VLEFGGWRIGVRAAGFRTSAALHADGSKPIRTATVLSLHKVIAI
jgi:hypothetical protein